MEGKTYRARGGRVSMDDAGLDVYSSRNGGTRLPWATIVDVEIGKAGKSGELRVLTVRLVNSESLTLPAPSGGARDAALFDAQAQEIIDAYEDRGAGWRVAASGEPQDTIPLEYRLEEARRIEKYGRPLLLFELTRPVSLVLLALFIAGLFGLAGSIHGYTRDLPGLAAYRAASACSALSSATGGTAPAYCIVTDGVVDRKMVRPYSDVYQLSVGPSAESAGVADGLEPMQFATFGTDQPALDKLQVGDPVHYIAEHGGDVASVTSQGVTYQSTGSPQKRYISDWASMFASAALALFFAALLGLRVARRRLTGPWIALPLSLILPFITDTSLGNSSTSRPPGSALSLLAWTALPVVCVALPLAALWCVWFKRQGRRLVSRRHRALP